MAAMEQLHYEAQTRSVQDLVNLYRHRQLNLEPGFQRDSVWSDRDRAKLVDSVFRNYPIPALFLHRNEEQGELYYDVVDGKQRLETFFRFMGLMRGKRFTVKTVLNDEDGEQIVGWKDLVKRELQHRLTGYSLQIIFVEGDLPPIVDLFVRINSTGRALNHQEVRNARFYKSNFLKKASALAKRFSERLLANRILSKSQIERMKDVELISELMLSCHYGDVIHKKQVLDQAMDEKGLPKQAVDKACQSARLALNRVFKMFPKLRQTRYRQISDFYSLVVLIHKLEREGCILNRPSRNSIAWALLSAFGAKVDEVRELHRKLQRIPPDLELYRRYLQTVVEGTDTAQQRHGREQILRGVLASQFAKKDKQRIFSAEQRRIIWHISKDHRCVFCGKSLKWDSFTVDHVKPHSRGGQTITLNAALAHLKCNAQYGDKSRK
jgi:5-methylcytosine-specific restriction endonuclease McrA